MEVCVTGNGRSGTSLVANFLHVSGIPMGIQMKSGGHDNPFGFWEDLEFLEFQKSVLKRNRSGLYTPWRKVRVSKEEERQAEEIIEKRRQIWDVWGWKDPRSTLFLYFWAKLLPNAKFLIMYRNPKSVLVSMYRQMGRLRYIRPDYAPRSWIWYNRIALDFYRKQPDRVAFLNISDLKDKSSEAIQALSEFLGFELNEFVFRSVYRPKVMTAHQVKYSKEPFISFCLKVAYILLGDEIDEVYRELQEVSIVK